MASASAPPRSADEEREMMALNMLIAVACAVQAADMAMFTSVLKVLEENFSVTPAALGVIIMLQGIGHCVAAPIWGYMSDRCDRLKLLYITMIMIAVLTMITAFAESFSFLCVIRLFTGLLTAGLGPIIQTMLALSIRAEDRGKSFGLMQLASQMGAAFGMMYGATMSHQEVFEYQGWRFAFVSMAFVTVSIASMLIVLEEALHKVLRRSLALTDRGNHSVWGDFLQIMNRKSFQIVLLQGAFATTAVTANNSFILMVYQYVGFTDFEASSLVTFVSIGVVCGSVTSGILSDIAATSSPNYGRIYYGMLGNFLSICCLLSLALFGDILLNVSHYMLLAVVTFFFGFFQVFAYVGAVKPILSEIVPSRVAGQTLAYASAIDGAVASFCGAPAVGIISQKVFGYQESDQEISEMPEDLRLNNLSALFTALMVVVVTCWLANLLLFSAMHRTYPEDRNYMSQSQLLEDKEAEESEFDVASLVSSRCVS